MLSTPTTLASCQHVLEPVRIVRSQVLALACLFHPGTQVNVVSYYDSFKYRNMLYIVMEYCDGGDLEARIKMHKKRKEFIAENQIMEWIAQLLSAVAFLHSQRVLHRDLKAGNVFLTKYNMVRLGDLGIARVLDHTMDVAATVTGTPLSLAPEVCENKPYSFAADMWAVGCVMYQCAALRHPFQASNLLGLVFSIVNDDPAPLPAHFSADLQDIVSRLLSKDAADRPSAEQLLREPILQAALMRLGDKTQSSVGQAIQRSSKKQRPEESGPGALHHASASSPAAGRTHAGRAAVASEGSTRRPSLTAKQRMDQRKRAEADRRAQQLAVEAGRVASANAARASQLRTAAFSPSVDSTFARPMHSAPTPHAQPYGYASDPRARSVQDSGRLNGSYATDATAQPWAPPHGTPPATFDLGDDDSEPELPGSYGVPSRPVSSSCDDDRPIKASGAYNFETYMDSVHQHHAAPRLDVPGFATAMAQPSPLQSPATEYEVGHDSSDSEYSADFEDDSDDDPEARWSLARPGSGLGSATPAAVSRAAGVNRHAPRSEREAAAVAEQARQVLRAAHGAGVSPAVPATPAGETRVDVRSRLEQSARAHVKAVLSEDEMAELEAFYVDAYKRKLPWTDPKAFVADLKRFTGNDKRRIEACQMMEQYLSITGAI